MLFWFQLKELWVAQQKWSSLRVFFALRVLSAELHKICIESKCCWHPLHELFSWSFLLSLWSSWEKLHLDWGHDCEHYLHDTVSQAYGDETVGPIVLGLSATPKCHDLANVMRGCSKASSHNSSYLTVLTVSLWALFKLLQETIKRSLQRSFQHKCSSACAPTKLSAAGYMAKLVWCVTSGRENHHNIKCIGV